MLPLILLFFGRKSSAVKCCLLGAWAVPQHVWGLIDRAADPPLHCLLHPTPVPQARAAAPLPKSGTESPFCTKVFWGGWAPQTQNELGVSADPLLELLDPCFLICKVGD